MHLAGGWEFGAPQVREIGAPIIRTGCTAATLLPAGDAIQLRLGRLMT
jgi:hypothetical protein